MRNLHFDEKKTAKAAPVFLVKKRMVFFAGKLYLIEVKRGRRARSGPEATLSISNKQEA